MSEQNLTAMDLRRRMAQTNLTEDQYREAFKQMSDQEQTNFFDMYNNPDIRSPEKFIGWLRVIKAL